MILCKRKIGFLFILTVFIYSDLFGQDAHFSQFYANPLYLNPAFAGTNNCPRFVINFRDQWPSLPGNFLDVSGSYDQHIAAISGGVGVLFLADIAGGGSGILNTYNASAIYNFRVKATHKLNLQFALQGGYLGTALNMNNLKYASDIIENAGPDFSPENLSDYSKSDFDAAFGVVGYTSSLYFGLALHHLFPHKLTFLDNSSNKFKTKWEPKLTMHIGGKITILQKSRTEVNAGDIFFYPNIVFISQGKFRYLHEGFYFNFYPFTIGTWLRHNYNFKDFDAVIVSCGIEYKLLRIGYSYDFTLTKLEGTGGAHEISLQFIIPCQNDKGGGSISKKRVQHAPVECPKF
jgi:type IX secretion system PorP/SprF family membrane protein